MVRDRRKAVRLHTDRRQARRRYPYDRVAVRTGNQGFHHFCTLVSASANGLALLIDSHLTPPLGSVIRPARHTRGSLWRQPAQVVRIDPVSAGLDLVAAAHAKPIEG